MCVKSCMRILLVSFCLVASTPFFMNQAFADNEGVWNIRFNTDDRFHSNEAWVRPWRSDTDDNWGKWVGNYSYEIQWGDTHTESSGSLGVNWNISDDGNIVISAERDRQWHAWTYVYVNEPKSLTIKATGDCMPRCFLNKDFDTPISFPATVNLLKGSNRVDITGYNQNNNYEFDLNFALADNVDKISAKEIFDCSTLTKVLEAENGSGDGEVKSRTNASGDKTVLLMSDESRAFSFDSKSGDEFQLKVRYSNDNYGNSETVKIAIDGDEIGSFIAKDTGNNGEGWNIFDESDTIEFSILNSGIHEIVLSVAGGDGHGVEIDKISLGGVGCDPFLTMSLDASPKSGAAPLTVDFDSSVSGGVSPYSFSWDFGDGSIENGENNVAYTYSSSGTYFCVVTVTDAEGKTASQSISITVTDECSTDECFDAGKQFCIDNPNQCGLFSQSDLDAKYQEGYEAGIANCDTINRCATFDLFTDMLHVPCLEMGQIYWVDLKLEGNHFKIDKFGEVE